MAKKKKYYVVWQGHNPGIYDSWTECQRQIKNFPDARYKAFTSLAAAEEAYGDDYRSYMGKNKASAKKRDGARPTDPNSADIVWESIAVDAACSGNPGKMEYQGVDTRTGEQLFHQSFALGTNNIGEFLGIVHGLAFLQQQKSTLPIYSDSKIAMKWVRDGKCRTKLKRTRSTAYLYQLIERAETWLKNNTYENQLLKWDTENWGEIPADFGRK